MVNPLKSKLKTLPNKPGVYFFKNKRGDILYIGKAKNLKSRVSQYFGKNDNRPQLPFLMAEAEDFSYIVASSELESLYLENTLIKEHLPPYNIKLRDDKNFAFLTIDYRTEIPQIGYARKIEDENKITFFGPFSSTKKIKSTLDLARKIFLFCANTQVGKRPCFYYHLHRCPGVCIGEMSLVDYHKHLKTIALFLAGDISATAKQIELEMKKASFSKRFEKAARLRDELKALRVLEEKQLAVLTKKVSWDIIDLYEDTRSSCVGLLKIRDGKLIDSENFVFDSATPQGELISKNEVLQSFLENYYALATDLPKTIVLGDSLTDEGLIKKLLATKSKKHISLEVARRGQKKKLCKLATTNAEAYLKKWLTSQAGNLDTINSALEKLEKILKLKSKPARIEGYDISNIQGTNPVGSMVVFIDGQEAKAHYRKFKIKIKDTPDDFLMMEETLTRRLSHLDTWPAPDLLVIDGGKGQLGVAIKVLKKLKLKIPVVGLAKRIEEIFVPGKSKSIVLPHSDPALQMLQRLRDEAHRYGITFHRQLRSKQAVRSALDEIKGVGPKTKKLLKQKFGTVAQIRKTSLAELEAIVGEKLAKKLKAQI